MLFPTVQANTLAGRCIVFPDETKGRAAIIFVAFEQRAQQQIDTWVEPFIGEYLERDDVAYYEIPMISGVYRPVSRFIDGGMRGGVPKDLHDRTATYYGKRGAFFDAMGITDQSKAYLYVLSRDGEIIFRASGSATVGDIESAKAAVETALATE
jgi:ATP10 protein